MGIILASGSPRRRELLGMLTDRSFSVIPAKGEELPPAGLGPAETVKALAAAKASEVAAECSSSDVIIGADTIVWHNGKMLGKPHSKEEAYSMLRGLSGCAHEVYTGIAVIVGGRITADAECSRVFFTEMTDEEIYRYIATGEPMDKAGAYGIQGRAGAYIERIEGDYYNIVGLPLCKLCKILKEQGVELF